MKVFFKEPGKAIRQMNVPNKLHTLQQLIGGYIESVTLCSDLVILCDEEGRLKGLPYNCEFCGIDFCGPIMFVGANEDGEFCDVPWTGTAEEFCDEVIDL